MGLLHDYHLATLRAASSLPEGARALRALFEPCDRELVVLLAKRDAPAFGASHGRRYTGVDYAAWLEIELIERVLGTASVTVVWYHSHHRPNTLFGGHVSILRNYRASVVEGALTRSPLAAWWLDELPVVGSW